MIRVTVTPKENETLYGLMVKKELTLRRQNEGTLRRTGTKKKSKDKWVHKSYNGWIRFQKCLGGILIVVVQARGDAEKSMLLTSFIGFLDRHFRDSISNINLSYESE